MTFILDHHPTLDAIVASIAHVMFIAGSAWLVAYSFVGRDFKGKRHRRTIAVVGAIGFLFWILLSALSWQTWSPWKVDIREQAIELHYLLSTERIEFVNIERAEFMIHERGKRRERCSLRLFSDEKEHVVSQAPEPGGELATRPVRQIFLQLAAKLPPNRCRDEAKAE